MDAQTTRVPLTLDLTTTLPFVVQRQRGLDPLGMVHRRAYLNCWGGVDVAVGLGTELN